MRIDNNLNGMLAAQMQINQNAQTIASTTKSSTDIENQETLPSNTQDFTNAMVDMVPQTIAYEANANGIKTKDEMMSTILDIKA